MAAMVSSTKPDSLSVSVWMGDLHVEAIRDGHAGVDGGGRRAPVLVQFQAAGAGPYLFFQGAGQAAVALAEKPRLIGNASAAATCAPCTRRPACKWWRWFQWPGRCAAEERRQAARQGRLDQLWTDEVDVAVDAAGREDQVSRRRSPRFPGPITNFGSTRAE